MIEQTYSYQGNQAVSELDKIFTKTTREGRKKQQFYKKTAA
jgi:hypothetical protein